MGLRFRRSVTICKGLRINFNKNSWGLSVGGRGYGYTFNSKGRKTAHVGIPGTGLSYVVSANSKKNYTQPSRKQPTIVHTTIKLHMDDDGKMTFFYPNGTEITALSLINKIKRTPEYKLEKERMQQEHNKEMLEQITEYNKMNDELVSINTLCTEKILKEQDYLSELENLKKEKYQIKSFEQPEPTEESVKQDLLKVARKEIRSVVVWTLNKRRNEYVESKYKEEYKIRHDDWLKRKEAFEQAEKTIEIEANKKYKEEFEEKKAYLLNIIEGNEDCVCNDIDIWFNDLELPFECNINYEYIKQENKLLIDLDLPEIEDFPNQKAIQLTNGNMKYKNKTQKELYEDYKNYVFGLAIFITGYIFNISPKIYNIIISGYTQRRNKVGQINDDYVYSIKFDREKMSQYDLIREDSFDICMKFENRCIINANGSLRTIEPYNRD